MVLLRRSDTFKTVIPSKIFEAMALSRPIILGVEGEARALVESGGAGLTITPEDAEALAAAIERLADDAALAQRLGTSGRAFVEREFDRTRLAATYADALQELVDRHR